MALSTNPFRYFHSWPEVIRLVVMMYVKYPLSLRNGPLSLSDTRRSEAEPNRKLHWVRPRRSRVYRHAPSAISGNIFAAVPLSCRGQCTERGNPCQRRVVAAVSADQTIR